MKLKFIRFENCESTGHTESEYIFDDGGQKARLYCLSIRYITQIPPYELGGPILCNNDGRWIEDKVEAYVALISDEIFTKNLLLNDWTTVSLRKYRTKEATDAKESE